MPYPAWAARPDNALCLPTALALADEISTFAGFALWDPRHRPGVSIALAGELVAAFGKCCVDTQEPMVRRTAALKLCDAAVAFGPQRIREEMLGAYQRLISEEEQESIRVNALKASAALFMVSTLSDAVGESYLACCADKSWRVRVAVSEPPVTATAPPLAALPRARLLPQFAADGRRRQGAA